MHTHEIGRILTYDYLLLVPLVAVIFNIFLIANKKWTELLIFNLAGVLNLAAEGMMILNGTRNFDTGNPLLIAAASACLAWVTNGFVFTVAYIDVKQWLKKAYPARFVIAANIILFAGLPLGMFHWGILDGAVFTWRVMGDTVKYVEPIAFVILAAVIFFTGYKNLLWRLLLIGFLLDLHFEAGLFIFGVRPPGQFDLITVGSRVLFEMNCFFMLFFLIVKAIFKLDGYRDANLE